MKKITIFIVLIFMLYPLSIGYHLLCQNFPYFSADGAFQYGLPPIYTSIASMNGLVVGGGGGGIKDNHITQVIREFFLVGKPVTKDEARALLIAITESLNNEIIKNRRLRKFFYNKNKILSAFNITIAFVDKEGRHRRYPELGGIIFSKDELLYFFFNDQGMIDSAYNIYESYAEAYEIVRGEPLPESATSL